MIYIKGSNNGIDTLQTLVRNLNRIEEIRLFDKIVLNKGKFITPLSILPITAYIQNYAIDIDFNDSTEYLKTIRFPYGVDIEETQNYNGTYFPITRVDLNTTPYHRSNIIEKCSDAYLNLLNNNIIEDPEFLEMVSKNVTGLLLTEMLANVEEHSDSNSLFLFSQYYHEIEACEICLVDLGVGIRGSLINAGYKDILTNKEALEKVITKQISAKDTTGRERGFGIKHVRSILSADEINGFFLIVSGEVAYYCDSKIERIIELGKFKWPGTFVTMRFSKPKSRFNITPYVT